MKPCPKCNTENPKAANYCRKCRYEFSEESKNGLSLTPLITRLQILEKEYVIGSVIHVEWEVLHYTTIELEGEDVTGYSYVELKVEKPMELHFVAKNDYTQISQVLRITPSPMPMIRFFAASSKEISKGQKIKLRWNVSVSKQLLLRAESETKWDVTSQNEIEVIPQKDTTYTLVAVSVDENIVIEEKINVAVYDNVVIHTFEASALNTIESQPVTLRWTIDSAEKIVLYPDNVDVTKFHSIQVYPKRTTYYRIVASNPKSVKESILTIYVMPLPKVNINMPDAIAELRLPTCNLDFSTIMESLKNTDINRWMTNPAQQSLIKNIVDVNVMVKFFKRVLKHFTIFHKPLTIFKRKLDL